MKRCGVLVPIAFVALLASCGDDDDDADAGGDSPSADVEAVLDEWSITMSEPSLSAGDHVIEASNVGAEAHELVVFRTDLAADALPVDAGRVPEDGEGLTFVGEIESFDAGGVESGTFEFEAGHYVLVCNLPDHYEQGMYTEIEVS